MAKKEKKVRIFSALEVADICGVVNQTAINWIKNGFLKAFMTPGGQYRVYAEDLLAFLSSRGMRIPDELSESSEEGPDWNKILIVDDDQNINTLLKRYLTRLMPERAADVLRTAGLGGAFGELWVRSSVRAMAAREQPTFTGH